MAHHHHHHHHQGDAAAEGPLDAANQSLADALKASFGILKLIMLVLVGLYCFSGVKCIEEQQQAVVLRFGQLLPEVRDSGLSVAFPYPIDETLVFPSKKHNNFTVTSHWPKVSEDQQAEALSQLNTGTGLNPVLDGSLMTADRGLVHVRWSVTYGVTNLRQYVLNVADQNTEQVEGLITAILENAATHVVAEYTAEEVTRGRSTEIASAVKSRINDELALLKTGVQLFSLDIPRSSVPGPTVAAFDAVARAENEKRRDESKARQDADEILNGIAGAAHVELIEKLDLRDAAEDAGDQESVARLNGEIDDLLETTVSGAARDRISQAQATYTQLDQKINGDVREYHAVLDEYLETPELFLNRMWEQTRQRVLNYDELTKWILPGRAMEIRLKLGADPRQREIEEQEKLQKEAEKRRFNPQTGHMTPLP